MPSLLINAPTANLVHLFIRKHGPEDRLYVVEYLRRVLRTCVNRVREEVGSVIAAHAALSFPRARSMRSTRSAITRSWCDRSM